MRCHVYQFEDDFVLGWDGLHSEIVFKYFSGIPGLPSFTHRHVLINMMMIMVWVGLFWFGLVWWDGMGWDILWVLVSPPLKRP